MKSRWPTIKHLIEFAEMQEKGTVITAQLPNGNWEAGFWRGPYAPLADVVEGKTEIKALYKLVYYE